MSRVVRWLVAAGVTVIVCGGSMWVCGSLVLPPVMKSGADRWVVAAGAGVALAAVAGLWGAWWAGQDAKVPPAAGHGPEPAREDGVLASGDRAIAIGGDNAGVAATGDGARSSLQRGGRGAGGAGRVSAPGGSADEHSGG
jgi:hypothetical protein